MPAFSQLMHLITPAFSSPGLSQETRLTERLQAPRQGLSPALGRPGLPQHGSGVSPGEAQDMSLWGWAGHLEAPGFHNRPRFGPGDGALGPSCTSAYLVCHLHERF